MVTEFRAVWTTPGGGRGYSVFHTVNPTTQGEADFTNLSLKAFFDDMKNLLPNEVSIGSDVEARVLNDVTGDLVSVFTLSQGWNIVGTNAGGYNRASGARIDWETGTIVGGRRLRGRTYVVPIVSTFFDSLGLLTPIAAQTLSDRAANLRTALSGTTALQVWSRTHGQARAVTGHGVPLAGAILRGRRD